MNYRHRFIFLITLTLFIITVPACQTVSPSTTFPPSVPPSPTVAPTRAAAPVDDPQPITISFACYEWQKPEFARLAGVFEQDNPDIRIRIVALNEIADLSRLTSENAAQLEAEIAYQIVAAADTAYWMPSLGAIRQGLLLDLAPLIEADPEFEQADFYPALWKRMVQGNRVWGVPAQADLIVLLYDRDAFDAAGLAYPQPGWNREDLLAAAQQLTLREGDEIQRYGLVDVSMQVAPFVQVGTGSLVDDSVEPPRPLLDAPHTAAALQWYIDLSLRHGVMPDPARIPQEWSNAQASRGVPAPQMWLYDLVNTGRAAMWINLLSGLPGAGQSGERRVGVAPLPLGEQDANPLYVQGYLISSGTAYREASWRWIKFLSRQHVMGGSAYSLPARATVAQQSGYWAQWDEADAAAVQYALDHAQAPLYTQIAVALQSAVEAVWAGQTAQDALAAAQVQASQSLTALSQATPVPPPVVASNQPDRVGTRTTIRFSCDVTEKNVWREAIEVFNGAQKHIWVELVDDAAPVAADCSARSFALATGDNTRAGLLDLQPLVDADPAFSLQDVYFVDAFRYQDALWGLPVCAEPRVVFFNRALFDRAGVAYPEPGWTTDDLVNKAIALTSTDPALEQYGLAFLNGQTADLPVFLALQGVELWDVDGYPRFDAPDVVTAVQWFADLALRHHVLPVLSANLSEADSRAAISLLVRQGRVAMWTDYSGIDRDLALPATMSVGIAPLPVSPNAAAAQFIYTGLFISGKTLHAQACWEWIKFASDYALFPGRMPARRSGWELDVEMWAGEEKDWDTYRTVLQYTPVPWSTVQQSDQLEWLDWAFAEILSGGQAASVLAEAQRQAQLLVD